MRAGEALIVRCAWCERVEIGRDWISVEELTAPARVLTQELDNVSHGLCPRCLDSLTTADADGENEAASPTHLSDRERVSHFRLTAVLPAGGRFQP